LLPVWADGIWTESDRCHRDGDLHVIRPAAVSKGFYKPACAAGHFAAGEVFKAGEQGFDFGCTIRSGLQGIASIESREPCSCISFRYAYRAFDGA
jgi:hypothetical protein